MRVYQQKMSYKYARGFSMIEVLVTLFVLSFGLLGISLLQNSAVQYMSEAVDQTVVAVSLSSLQDEMKAGISGNETVTRTQVQQVALARAVKNNPLLAGNVTISYTSNGEFNVAPSLNLIGEQTKVNVKLAKSDKLSALEKENTGTTSLNRQIEFLTLF